MDFSAAMLGFKQVSLAFAAVKIGLPKLLNKAPMSVEQIARATGLPADRLDRVLRGLVWCDVLKILDDGRYALAPAGSELVDDRANSLSDDIRFQGEFLYRAFGELYEYLVDGRIPFNRAHGIGIFEHLGKNPDLAHLYAAPMAQRCTEYSDIVAKHPLLDEVKTFVDVAGGLGQLLIDVLKHRTQATGVIFDLLYMRPQAQEAIARAGLGDRCKFEAGDFFQSVPAGAEMYFLKWILHDFSDEPATAILRSIAAAMSPSSRLLIIERLMPPRITCETGLMQGDLNMLCLSGGAERTLDQYRDLCKSAGLTVGSATQVETAYGFHLIEATRG